MAQIISEQLDIGKGMEDDDINDFKETGFGYREKSDDEKSWTW